MMAKKLIVANWKMHHNIGQASMLLHRLQEHVPTHRDVDVVLCPSFLALQSLSSQIDRHKFKLGAQNCFDQDEGAFTGEVSATMLKGLVDYTIVGHSERRYKFDETDKLIAAKVAAVARNGITPILCVGETEAERKNKETSSVLHDQVTTGLRNLTTTEVKKMVIAYEPVWAIGTGKFAHPADVVEAITIIRKHVQALYGGPASHMVRILYGGSVNAHNATAYLQEDTIDGLLVGGASLNYAEFSKIVVNAHNIQNER